ncbi:imidazole glycerol phosphate synthase subunit HisF [Macrococcus animalis]|uniref:imidazole glycerol phosphate synthase subunit HisF n=1 Tax=Macrococcus animalis TaxID=3395467 RepID=UPI0039BF53DD
MIKKRIIPCLDVKDGMVVKGVQFQNLRDIGDPVELAKYYNASGADELVFLDISKTEKGHDLMLEVIKRTSETLFIPLTIGGGIQNLEDITALLMSGADKVSLNSTALRSPDIINAASQKFGSQCICIAIDAKWHPKENDWFCYSHGGKQPTSIPVLDWVIEVEKRGAGELLVTSMDYDGMKQGFDHQLLSKIQSISNIPIIASGGAGHQVHFAECFKETDVSACLAASIFHDQELLIHDLKTYLTKEGVAVRCI